MSEDRPVVVHLTLDEALWLEQAARHGAARPFTQAAGVALKALAQRLLDAMPDEDASGAQ